MRSLSEIETAVKRASRAIGFSWGDSEEIGKSIRLLELFGLHGIKSLNQYYKERESKNFESLNSIKKKNEPSSESFCPITLGISFLDQIKKIENFETIQIKKIAYPIIFLSFLSRASEVSGKKIHAKFDKNSVELSSAAMPPTYFFSSKTLVSWKQKLSLVELFASCLLYDTVTSLQGASEIFSKMKLNEIELGIPET